MVVHSNIQLYMYLHLCANWDGLVVEVVFQYRFHWLEVAKTSWEMEAKDWDLGTVVFTIMKTVYRSVRSLGVGVAWAWCTLWHVTHWYCDWWYVEHWSWLVAASSCCNVHSFTTIALSLSTSSLVIKKGSLLPQRLQVLLQLTATGLQWRLQLWEWDPVIKSIETILNYS